MTSPDDPATQMRNAQIHLGQGDHGAALAILSSLIKGGVTDWSVFQIYRETYTALHGHDLPHAEIFDFIYSSDAWEGGSGAGSRAQATVAYRIFLQAFLIRKNIRSVVDAGCGDWQSSQLIDWRGIDYLGIDVSSVILRNTRRFERNGVRFLAGDVRTIDLPRADLLIVKDVLQHWSNADIMALIPKFRNFRYCLIANGATEQVRGLVNIDVPAGGYRSVDLSRPPFSLSGTFVLSYEVPYETHAEGAVCSQMRVFQIDQ